jgi:hypothetical protein
MLVRGDCFLNCAQARFCGVKGFFYVMRGEKTGGKEHLKALKRQEISSIAGHCGHHYQAWLLSEPAAYPDPTFTKLLYSAWKV